MIVYNSFLESAAKGSVVYLTDTVKAILVMTSSTIFSQNDGIVYVGDFTTLDECNGTNYVRKTLANKTVTKSDANDWAYWDADDITWTALGAGSRALMGVLLYKHVSTDANSPVICSFQFASSVTLTDTNFPLAWSSNGILRTRQYNA